MNTATTLHRTVVDALAARQEQLTRTIDLALVRLYTGATGRRSWWTSHDTLAGSLLNDP
ncbi:MAG: hypothetical protein HOQ24_15220 [Mycobacteriaceae bacterium]|nr:hypothetical protein [Mycobacteriaceae bacterium]